MIPRIIHQIWINPELWPVPEFTNSWRDYASKHGWEYHLWTDKEIIELGLKWRACYEATNSPHNRSDIARIEILSRFGGFYFDCDFISSGTALETFIPLDHVDFVGVPEHNPDLHFVNNRHRLSFHNDSPVISLYLASGWLGASLRSKTIARAMEDLGKMWAVCMEGFTYAPNMINASICEPVFLIPNTFTSHRPGPPYPHLTHVGHYAHGTYT
jgi:hypothetical protein